MNDKIQDIRKQLRLNMDGKKSSSMREKGLDYKMNFGVSVVKLKELARKYYPDPKLAEELWREDTRELRILASMIQNPNSFEHAEIWLKGINNNEIAEQCVMNLFSKIKNAKEFALQWIVSKEPYTKLCGFLLIAKLLAKGIKIQDSDKFLDTALKTYQESTPLVKERILSALRFFGRQSEDNACKILDYIVRSECLSKENKEIIGEELKFAFEYYR